MPDRRRPGFPRKAVVLAAGLGARMQPLSHTTPKALVPLWGKPMLGRVLDLLAEVAQHSDAGGDHGGKGGLVESLAGWQRGLVTLAAIAAVIVGGRVSWWRLLTMPVNLATITGLAISITAYELPQTIHLPITMLGQIAIPLMLVALGVRMVSVDLRDWRIGVIGAVVRPAVGVAAAFFILMLLPLEPLQRSQLLLFAALPPAVLNFIFAEKHQRGPKSVASIVLVGNALSVVFLSLMLLYLNSNSL